MNNKDKIFYDRIDKLINLINKLYEKIDNSKIDTSYEYEDFGEYGYNYEKYNKNEIYFHYKNKKSYIVLDFGKIQEDDKWVKAVIYKEHDKDKKEKYIRTFSEFSEKFLERNVNE